MNKQERNESAREVEKSHIKSELNSGRAQVDDDLRIPILADSYSGAKRIRRQRA
jgi:stress-induced morphogen